MFYLLSFFSLFALAQETVTLKGTLLEKGTRNKLREVNVFLLPLKLKAVTDVNGSFTFENVPMGECTLIVNVTGYEKLEEVNLCRSSVERPFYIERKSYSYFETTVTAKVNKRDDQTQTLTQEQFIAAPGSFGGDPVRAAQNLPGVAANGASAEIIIQGAGPDDTGYLINGHRVPIVFHFGGLSSVIIPQAVDRVDLLPSGYGPEYSRAIGGIVGLTTKDPKTDRAHGMAFVDVFNTGGLFEGPIDEKSSLFVGGRYSYVGQVLKEVAKRNDNFDLTAAPTFFDFTTIYKRRLSEKNEFRTTFLVSKDELDLILNKPAANDPALRGNFYNRTEFFRIIPQLTTTFSETTKLDNSVGIGRDLILVNIGGRYLDVNSNIVSQRSELEHRWSGRSRSFIGLDNQYNDNRVGVNLPSSYNVGGVRTPFSVGDKRKFESLSGYYQLGAYVRQELKTSEDSKWTFLPNLRIDHFSLNEDTVLQPRLQVRREIDPSLTVRASVGRYVQPPQPQEVDKFYGNSNIRSPKADHYTVGYTKDFRAGSSDGFEFTNNYFYKDLRDLVVPDIRKNYDSTGTGTILGAEVQGKYKRGEWSSQIVYTLLRSERRIPGFGTAPAEFDQTHNLNIIGAYNREKWTFSGRFRFVTGNPYTPIAGATFDADNDVYVPIRGGIYSQRFENFRQLDLRIDRRYVFDEWILTAYVDIQNVLNTTNSQNFQYAYDYREKKKVRGLPILPAIGVKGEF